MFHGIKRKIQTLEKMCQNWWHTNLLKLLCWRPEGHGIKIFSFWGGGQVGYLAREIVKTYGSVPIWSPSKELKTFILCWLHIKQRIVPATMVVYEQTPPFPKLTLSTNINKASFSSYKILIISPIQIPRKYFITLITKVSYYEPLQYSFLRLKLIVPFLFTDIINVPNLQ